MGEIVNLRQARKRKLKAIDERKAETNRALFGRTKSERDRDRLLAKQAEAHLEAHRREDGGA